MYIFINKNNNKINYNNNNNYHIYFIFYFISVFFYECVAFRKLTYCNVAHIFL